MLYLCTIYRHDYTFGGTKGFTGTEPAYESPVARVRVSGSSLRHAAARAYVRAVGRRRAATLRRQARVPDPVIAQETSPRAIAASLRKTVRRNGEGFELDLFLVSWFIRVEAVPAPLPFPHSLPASPN